MKGKVLILGGKPIGTLDIINYLKENNYYVIVTDNLPNDSSEAKQIADETWDISTSEVEQICERAKNNNVCAVFTGVHEFNLARTLEVCNKLGLPFYATSEQLYKTSIKSVYKQLFRKFDIPIVPEYKLDNESLEEFSTHLDYPILVKPSDGSSGLGITICSNKKEFFIGYEKAINSSKSREVLIEKYIKSTEATIFYIIQDGNIMLSAMADRHVRNASENVIPLPVLYTFPSVYLDRYIQDLNNKVIKALQSLELQNGMLFIQTFANEEGFLFYDIGFRLTGTQEYNILESLCGYNALKMMTHYALTGKMWENPIQGLVDPYLNEKYAFNITFLAKPSVIAKFIGLEKVASLNGILKVIKNYPVGHKIPEIAIGTLNQVVLRVLGVAEMKSEMLDLINKVILEIDVVDNNDNSILLPTINVDELI